MHHLQPEVSTQIAAVQTVLQQLLGGKLCALHLFGSAVEGGLKPCSDIDLMVTVTGPLPESLQQRLLQTLLAHSAWPGSDPGLRALEVTVVALSEVRPWRYPPRREMQFGEWLRADIQAGRYEPAMTDNDLAILFTKLRVTAVRYTGLLPMCYSRLCLWSTCSSPWLTPFRNGSSHQTGRATSAIFFLPWPASGSRPAPAKSHPRTQRPPGLLSACLPRTAP
ncbi:streptomycin 3'-adenylyltransferase [Delftia acidovorans CCUG 15835]|nr:streptomycin 3'-adenylyltransferase [Delftia acidovorans CCUG 15835]